MFRLCSILLLLALPVSAEILSGPIRVIDADTFDIGAGANVRLLGIDAAEGDQTCTDVRGATLACGAMATASVRHLFEGRTARCAVQERDRYDRFLAVCEVDGRVVNAGLVRLGLARVYRGGATYAAEEAGARREGRGLWAYEMLDPAEWRDRRRGVRTAGAVPAGPCRIKGNVSENGRIYHMPGSRHYEETRISETRGERWFCSEEEAQSAGWRAARSY